MKFVFVKERGCSVTKCLYIRKIGCVQMQAKSQFASSLRKYSFRISKFKVCKCASKNKVFQNHRITILLLLYYELLLML